MSGCSSRVDNHKRLKTEEGDGVDSTMTSSCLFPETYAVPDCGGEFSSGSASKEVHPLQNIVILSHLFELCPVDVLATCRLVCQQWYEESLRSWRNSTSLTFTLENGHIFMKYFGYDGADHVIPLENFLEYAADPNRQFSRKPYRNIQIKDSTIDTDIAIKTQFKILWNAFGRNLTTLELKNCEFPDHEEFRRVVFIQCPNLKSLIIDRCKFPSTRDSSFPEARSLDYEEQPFGQNKHLKSLKIVGCVSTKFPITWLELLNHFPLLSSFSISNGFLLRETMFNNFIKAVRIIGKERGKLLSFKLLDIGNILCFPAYWSTKDKLTALKELCLPLQFENLFVMLCPQVDDSFFRDTFASSATTLKDITLHEDLPTPSFSEFPFGHQLDNLLNLSIKGTFCENLAFLKYMPNLETLDIGNYDDPRKLAISNADEPVEATHLKMTSLTTLTLRSMLKAEDIAKLHDWMPKVTDLTIVLNDRQFGILCEKWTNLKKLMVYGQDLTDEGVTGIKNKDESNITNLQSLEEFSFESKKLTDKSVFNGLLKLPHLRALVKFRRGPPRWGEAARQAIQDRMIRME